jgi:DNA-binding NarL/FixJ family response regulator
VAIAEATDAPLGAALFALGAGRLLDARTDHLETLVRAVTELDRTRQVPVVAFGTPAVHPAPLSPRQREVLGCVCAGHDNLKIAALLGIRERTVKAHVSALYQKLGMENRTQLALRGLEFGLGAARGG